MGLTAPQAGLCLGPAEPSARSAGKTLAFGNSVKKTKISLHFPLIKALRLTSVIMMIFPHLFLKLHLSSCQASLYLNNNEYPSSLKLISPASLGTTPSTIIYLTQILYYFASVSPDPT